jgi:hypothetical protein
MATSVTGTIIDRTLIVGITRYVSMASTGV